MMRSLRVKLFAAVGGLIVFYVLFSAFLNNVFLEKYYHYSKKQSVLDSYQQINSFYKNESEDTALELEKLENAKGLQIIILDSNFKVIYSTRPTNREQDQRRPPRGGFMDIQNMPENMLRARIPQILQDKLRVETFRDNRLNTSFIRLMAALDNGYFIYLNTPVAAIQESVSVANDFFLLTGLLTIIIGFVLVFFLTERFTQPILQLNKITRKMATLDFSSRYPVKGRDEIGQLGESINSLSEQLQKSILELQEANQKLLEDIEKERKIDEMRKEFISSVSHELKTPIALIQGYAAGLKFNVNKDEENKNFYCEVILDESVKMNKLVKQLLELSQIESGAINLEKTGFDISQLVHQVMKKNSLVFEEKEIQATVTGVGNISVYADFDRVEQVLVNYLSNAVNHVDDQKRIQVGIVQLGRKCRISVYNSGKRIPEESLDKIWGSFYKIDKSRTRSYGGTGLGLSIVRAIQEAHGNGYGVLNREDGVEFWFEMDIV